MAALMAPVPEPLSDIKKRVKIAPTKPVFKYNFPIHILNYSGSGSSLDSDGILKGKENKQF
jgi:hypothetical protein